MIALMDQITVVGRRSIAHELLVSLQSLGVVQVDPLDPGDEVPLHPYELSPADRRTKEAWDALVARAEALLDALELRQVKAARGEIPAAPEELQELLAAIGKQIDKLVAERGELRDELEVAGAYLPILRELAPTLAQFDHGRYLAGTAFTVPADRLGPTLAALEEELEGRVAFSTRSRERDVLVVAAVLKRDLGTLEAAIARAGLAEFTLPEGYGEQGVAKAAHVMEERSQTLPKRLAAIQAELAKLAEQHGPRLAAILTLARNQQARYERLSDMAAGRYSFALRGWVPSGDRERVVEGLRKQFGEALAIETRAADEHHDAAVPVKLDNPRWVKPFEGLLALFAPPRYGSFDPSWTLAVFFPLFFGLVVGDIGFGLMFAALAYWMRRRGEAGRDLSLGLLGVTIGAGALKPVSTVILWCAGWSILFGFLYGEFFGNLLEQWPAGRPIFYTPLEHEAGYGWIPIVLFRVEQFTPILLLSLGFGILQVLGGWAIRVVYGAKHRDLKHVWEGVGMIGGLSGLIVFSYAFLQGGVTPLASAILVIGLVVFLVGMVMSRVFLMLIELASNAGNILSYLRLFAVGLSAALVANLSTDLGFALGGTLPIIGPILGIVVGLAVHLLALALTIIGHTLQPLRLNYVEFFTKFGFYDESGRPYQPFRLIGGKG